MQRTRIDLEPITVMGGSTCQEGVVSDLLAQVKQPGSGAVRGLSCGHTAMLTSGWTAVYCAVGVLVTCQVLCHPHSPHTHLVSWLPALIIDSRGN